MQIKLNKWSGYTYIFCVVIMSLASFVFYPRWNKTRSEAVIAYDVAGYYWYLPSAVIYHDVKHQAFKDTIMAKYAPLYDFQQAFLLPNGNYSMKYSSGMAVMYLPFFTSAHLLAGVLGYPRDGFSVPYQLALQSGGFLVALIGLWYLRKILLRFYTDIVTSISMLLLVIGTNYLNYSVIDAGMSHNWLFTLYVFIIWNTIYFYESGKLKYAVFIGLLVGLATLTRPTDAISCLIPLLWGMESITPKAIKRHVLFLAGKYKMLLIAGLCAAAVVSIQLLYWKYVSGSWLVYSYGNQKLYFRSPNVFNYTFDYNSGWLLYTPMMIFAFLGLIPFIRSGKHKVAIITFFLLNYYIVCCWSEWRYGGRAMVQSYPILMFPLAAFINVVVGRKVLAYIVAPFALVFAYMNIWITINYHYVGLYDNSFMTSSYFWRAVGRWHLPDYYAFLKDETELFEGKQEDKRILMTKDFENDSTHHISADPVSGSRSLELNATVKDAIEYKIAYLNSEKQHWLAAEADFHCDFKEQESWKMPQFIFTVYKNGKILKKNMIRVDRLLADGETKRFPIYMNIKNVEFDSVGIACWNAGSSKKLFIDNIVVYALN